MERYVERWGSRVSRGEPFRASSSRKSGRKRQAQRRRRERRKTGAHQLAMTVAYLFLGIAAIPFIYYLIAIFSSWRYFQQPVKTPDPDFHPPVSNLKPIRGLDPEAYENLASFCRQDYPDYEIVLCIDSDDEAVIAVLEKLKANFPE